MKKLAVIFLIVLGVIFGWWLARENRKLFELPAPAGRFQRAVIDKESIVIGMDTWQVKEVLGVPEKRHVVLETQEMRKEEWIYGDRHFYFTNGFLTSLKE
jgi:hypothetical protein